MSRATGQSKQQTAHSTLHTMHSTESAGKHERTLTGEVSCDCSCMRYEARSSSKTSPFVAASAMFASSCSTSNKLSSNDISIVTIRCYKCTARYRSISFDGRWERKKREQTRVGEFQREPKCFLYRAPGIGSLLLASLSAALPLFTSLSRHCNTGERTRS